MTDTAATATEKIPQQPIRARHGRYYRNMRYVMVVALIGFAAYFGYDGWVGYPKLNTRIDEVVGEIQRIQSSASVKPEDKAALERLDKEKRALGDKKNDTAIMLQKALALGLPVVALAYLAFFLHRSRGEIRLEDDTLHAPGHPPVQIDSIKTLDGKLWRKKGIAVAHYETGGKSGKIRLDAFLYQQKPMDDIYEVIARRHGVWESTRPDKA